MDWGEVEAEVEWTMHLLEGRPNLSAFGAAERFWRFNGLFSSSRLTHVLMLTTKK